jgi:hypothetical protein
VLKGSRSPIGCLVAIVVAVVGIAVVRKVENGRADRAVVEEMRRRLDDGTAGRLDRAAGHAQIVASSTDIREGVSQRNRVILRRALRAALEQMDVNYAGIVLADSGRYYALPTEETTHPLLTRRVPIEYELRTIAELEYGVLLDDDFVAELGRAAGTPLAAFAQGRIVAGSSEIPAPPPPPPAVARTWPPPPLVHRPFAYAPIGRHPTDKGTAALVGFRISADAPAAARIRRERNIIWGALALAALAVVSYDIRRLRRVQPMERPYAPITNPYIVGNPIRTSEMFFGRDDDFQFARQKLTSERGGVVLVFCGERRSGKTSILFQILSGRFGPGFVPVLIDMQYFAAISDDADLYRSI